MTEAAADAYIALAAAAVVVPTTTRTPEQLARVHLPGPPARYAIAANGGHLVVDGVPDEDWAARVRVRLRSYAPLAEVIGRLRAHVGSSAGTVRTASDLFAYVVVDRDAITAAWLAELQGWCGERGWTVSLQGRKLYCVPRLLTKSAAAAELVAHLGGDVLLAAGDSLLDLDLLVAADVAVRPRHGELLDLAAAARIRTTATQGVAAGEELLVYLRDTARGDGGRTVTGGPPPRAPGP